MNGDIFMSFFEIRRFFLTEIASFVNKTGILNLYKEDNIS